MRSVRERLDDLDKELGEVKRVLKFLTAHGGIVPEYADLKTISRLFGQYSPATLRYRISAGIIPAEMVRKEERKYLVDVCKYRELVIHNGGK